MKGNKNFISIENFQELFRLTHFYTIYFRKINSNLYIIRSYDKFKSYQN